MLPFYTGMRYVELQRFQDHSKWFQRDRRAIYLPPEAQLKKERKFKDRYVCLSNVGMYAVQYFLALEQKLPSIQAWNKKS